jgi:hypothetical protein
MAGPNGRGGQTRIGPVQAEAPAAVA